MVANCFFVLFSLLLPAANDTSFAIYQQNIPGTNVHFKMIPITGGHFVMGSGDAERGRKADEGPAKQVTVGSFWIEEHEVTYDEYILFADEQLDKDPKPDAITRPSPPYIDFTLGMGKTGGYPANSMSQYAAMAYCHWLYKKTGIFYRLPTEAEWEYAARAGTQTAFFFGEDDTQLDEFAWHAANSGGKYHKVMEKKPNAWGLYDMAGNVAEWTLDQYKADYFEMIKADTIEPWMIPQKKHPVSLRGGAFHDVPDNLRCAARLKSELKWNARDPQIPRSKWWNTDAPFIGFRIVRPKKQPTPAEAENFYVQFLSLK
jgi:formylglycine-generating enzyme required for sulfatase activity